MGDGSIDESDSKGLTVSLKVWGERPSISRILSTTLRTLRGPFLPERLRDFLLMTSTVSSRPSRSWRSSPSASGTHGSSSFGSMRVVVLLMVRMRPSALSFHSSMPLSCSVVASASDVVVSGASVVIAWFIFWLVLCGELGTCESVPRCAWE